ncbi:hypothetical protein CPB86DRAFT_799625 [Serendipita vermifera]|nr:hypothetical protein CPB86DRAFT_799625 [Serendipita vermifera]
MSDLKVSTGTSNSNARVDKTNGKKRESGGDDARRPTKRLKSLTQEESQRMSIQEYTEQLRVALANLKSLPETSDIVDDDIKDSINNLLPRVCDKILEDPPHATTLAILQDPIPTFKDNTNFQRLNSMQQAHFRFFVQDVSNQLTKIAKVYKELLEDEKYAPSATQYADPTVWPKWQGKEAGILNLRPSTNQGLPLSILHSIFARFRATLHQQLSGVAAMQAAHNLCVKMPDAFETEKRRREVFMDYSDLERHPSTADLVLSYRTSDVLVGVCDLECGTGDAYMRISRVYQAWVNRLKDHKSSELAHGVPLILICVMGPVFIVSGGFFDGDSVLVEPLAQPCLMLPDYHHQRQSQLASVLHATKEAVEGLLQYDNNRWVDNNRGIALHAQGVIAAQLGAKVMKLEWATPSSCNLTTLDRMKRNHAIY